MTRPSTSADASDDDARIDEATGDDATADETSPRPTTAALSRVSRRSFAKATGGLVGLAAVSGLGASQEGTETGGDQSAGIRIGMVSATNGPNFYSDPVQWVEAGSTVTWELVQGAHTATAYAEANDRPQRVPADATGWDSGLLDERGATFERTFEAPGVYDYFCRPHESLGMVGRVVVGTPDLANEPALAEPQDSLPDAAAEMLAALNAVTTATFGRGQGAGQ
ncbi:halocyanin [Halorubellus sp. JP-L1]|uniref:plastocyanin/azurin family copper-binding protein n=1 Tax=Halorubellus sp. JP-L1 TaxID=2715753 RepID=UPI00140C52AC|nr:plastocyanin/azurin family copper-binding protein [Halorubellus sp. JP-L1]NHN42437.1 halocyanin [Halorubellus sp. JP-L1]